LLGDAEGVGEGEFDFAVCTASDGERTREAIIAGAREVVDFVSSAIN
jgi:hypothetical protein